MSYRAEMLKLFHLHSKQSTMCISFKYNQMQQLNKSQQN